MSDHSPLEGPLLPFRAYLGRDHIRFRDDLLTEPLVERSNVPLSTLAQLDINITSNFLITPVSTYPGLGAGHSQVCHMPMSVKHRFNGCVLCPLLFPDLGRPQGLNAPC